MYRPYERRFSTSLRTSVFVDAALQRADPPSTDNLSNAISLSQSEASGFLNDASSSQVSDRLLLLFLHEATHHASFANYFGAALSALAISSSGQGGLPGPLPKNKGDLALPARDYLVLRWVEAVYAPLLEGTALFAEYDLLWGDFENTSPALAHAVRLFLLNELKGSYDTSLSSNTGASAEQKRFWQFWRATRHSRATATLADRINARLTEARMAATTIEQKDFLLSSPLIISGTDSQPYLLGYLAVKRAYLVQRQRFAPLRDVELFLNTMCDYWFGDSELFDLLLSLNDAHFVTVQMTLKKISEHLQDRWSSFYNPKTIAISANAAMKPKSDDDRTTLQDVLLSDRALPYGERTLPYESNVFAQQFVKHRMALRYAMTPIDIECHDGCATVHDINNGTVMARVPSVPLADIGDYPGTIELVCSDGGEHHGLVVLGPTGLVAVKDMRSGEWNLPQLIEQFDDLPSLDHVKAMVIASSKSSWSHAFDEGEEATMYKHNIDQSSQLRNLVHLQIAFPGARESDRLRIVETIGNSGFSGLFGTGHQLRQLARYSVAFGGPGASLEAVAARMDISAGEIERQLAAFNLEAKNALGVNLFEITGQHVTSAV